MKEELTQLKVQNVLGDIRNLRKKVKRTKEYLLSKIEEKKDC